jgi:hypothetical protein
MEKKIFFKKKLKVVNKQDFRKNVEKKRQNIFWEKHLEKKKYSRIFTQKKF